MKIARAQKEDVTEMVSLGYKFWKQTAYHKQGFEYDPEQVTKLTEHLLENGVVQIAREPTGKIVGMILLIISTTPFNTNITMATELVFYVDENYRSEGVGMKLIKQAENVAGQLGVKLFNMVHLDSVNPDKPESLYNTAGYKKSETVFTKEL